LALTCHEFAHGYVAYRLGDPTAKFQGRLTFNPLKHIDIFGTIIFPVLLWLLRFPVIFGWAKPVPVDPRYFRRPLKGMMWVGMAGPLANILLALGSAILFRGSVAFLPFAALANVLFVFVLVNTILAVFNLIPIPPLDGSRILAGLLPQEAALRFLQVERYGFVILFLLLWSGVFGRVIYPLALGLAGIFTGVRLYG